MMVFAEHEARAINARTKQRSRPREPAGRSWAAGELSSTRFAAIAKQGRAASIEVRTRAAAARRADRLGAIQDIQAIGAKSLREIAGELNERGIPTPSQKGPWSAVQVRRVLAA